MLLLTQYLWSLIWYNNYEFKYHFYAYTEYKTPYPLTNSTYVLASASFHSSDFIVTPTPTVTQGKWALWLKITSCFYYVNFRLMFCT